jgi:opacity protein-like surface antigen
MRLLVLALAAVLFALPALANPVHTQQITFNGRVATLKWTEGQIGATFGGGGPTGLGTGFIAKSKTKGFDEYSTMLGVRFDGDNAAYMLVLTNDYRDGRSGFYILYHTDNGLNQGSESGQYSATP